MTTTGALSQAVDDIVAALDARNLDTARRHFDTAVKGMLSEALTAFLKQLADTVTLPPGTVLFGFGIDVWANPRRTDYAWRCGGCPWTGSNYTTADGARSAAEQHVTDDHPSNPIAVVDYCSDAYWEAITRSEETAR